MGRKAAFLILLDRVVVRFGFHRFSLLFTSLQPGEYLLHWGALQLVFAIEQEFSGSFS
jgi:hypothetical protein